MQIHRQGWVPFIQQGEGIYHNDKSNATDCLLAFHGEDKLYPLPVIQSGYAFTKLLVRAHTYNYFKIIIKSFVLVWRRRRFCDIILYP